MTAHYDPKALVQKLGERAVRACMLTAGGKDWTPQTVITAGNALTEGSSVAGVRRPWPSLGKRLKVIGATWMLLHKGESA